MSAILISYFSFLTCEPADKQIGMNGLLIIFSVEIDMINEEFNNINSQLDATLIILLTITIIQHVSSDNFAHPQEH